MGVPATGVQLSAGRQTPDTRAQSIGVADRKEVHCPASRCVVSALRFHYCLYFHQLVLWFGRFKTRLGCKVYRLTRCCSCIACRQSSDQGLLKTKHPAHTLPMVTCHSADLLLTWCKTCVTTRFRPGFLSLNHFHFHRLTLPVIRGDCRPLLTQTTLLSMSECSVLVVALDSTTHKSSTGPVYSSIQF